MTLRITTWNVNGLRAAERKGFFATLDELQTDVLLLQEVRALPEQLSAEARAPEGWHVHWNPAERKGYAGTALWSRTPIEVLHTGLESGEHDVDGRVTVARTAGVVIGSIYLPSGSASPERQAAKEAWMTRFKPWAAALAASPEPVVLGGDLNIAHTNDDIHNPAGNKNNSGFLPHERAWFTELLATGWTDAQRTKAGPGKGPYSWWSNRGQARALDRGWRIDYLLCNSSAAERLSAASTLRAGGLTVSDHAPVSVELRA